MCCWCWGVHSPCAATQGDGKARSEWRQTAMLAIPTAFDLVATVLMNVGLLSVTASVYQMMRGAEMLFAALFAVLFLRRTLNRFHLLGILCCVARARPAAAQRPVQRVWQRARTCALVGLVPSKRGQPRPGLATHRFVCRSVCVR